MTSILLIRSLLVGISMLLLSLSQLTRMSLSSKTHTMKLLLILGLVFCAEASLRQQLKRAFQCGDQSYHTTNNGEITSHTGYDVGHNYGKNLNCIWRVEAPFGMNVELVAETFTLESDSACSYDYLELFDGNSTSAPSLGKFCGNIFSAISSTQRFLTLNFVTDDDTQLSGFKMFYNFTNQVIHTCHSTQWQCANGKCIDAAYRCDNDDDCGDDSDEQNCAGFTPAACTANDFMCPDMTCISRDWLCDGDDDCGDNTDELPLTCGTAGINSRSCGETNLTGTAGTITSPDFPQDYPSGTHCVYYIQAPVGTKMLSFKFDETFHIEPDTACSYDFVKITMDGTTHVHGPYCGDVSPGQVVVQGDHAYVLFNTDDSDQYQGFRLDWKVLQ